MLKADIALPDNVIVLRSCGKFFGLAGIRLGFVFACESVRLQLQELLGLWMISGPTQAIAIQALNDTCWQQQARVALNDSSAVMRDLLSPLVDQLKPAQISHHPLFSSYRIDTRTAYWLQDYFARQAILLRVIAVDDRDSILRVGLLDSCKNALHARLQMAVAGAVAELNQVSCRDSDVF